MFREQRRDSRRPHGRKGQVGPSRCRAPVPSGLQKGPRLETGSLWVETGRGPREATWTELCPNPVPVSVRETQGETQRHTEGRRPCARTEMEDKAQGRLQPLEVVAPTSHLRVLNRMNGCCSGCLVCGACSRSESTRVSVCSGALVPRNRSGKAPHCLSSCLGWR